MLKKLTVLLLLMLIFSSCQKQDFEDEYVVRLPDTPPEAVETLETVDTVDIPHTPPAAVRELEGKIICIDPGHGQFTKGYKEPIGPGATEMKAAFVSGTSGAYQTEAEFNLKMAYLLKGMLEEKGAEVHMTRSDENAALSNIGRAEFANDLGCDMVVRIHADGSENTSAKGISVLIPAQNQYLNDPYVLSASKNAGQYVLDSMISAAGAENRGLILRDDLTGFNWTKVPCILVECGFMSNPEDDMLLADENYRILLARGITNGLIEYYMTVQ